MFETAMFYETMEKLIEKCHTVSRSKGFWDGDNDNVPTKIALMHSELSELLEAYRSGNPDCEKKIVLRGGEYEGKTASLTIMDDGDQRTITSMEEECADVFIRLCDFCGRLGIDLARVTLVKLAYNAQRDHMHGDKKC